MKPEKENNNSELNVHFNFNYFQFKNQISLLNAFFFFFGRKRKLKPGATDFIRDGLLIQLIHAHTLVYLVQRDILATSQVNI